MTTKTWWLMVALSACTVEEAPTPSLSILSPEDGAEVTAGAVPFTVVVEEFGLIAPMLQHGDGEQQRGTIVATVGGEQIGEFGDTNFDLTLDEPGAVTVDLELIHEDGESLEPPVKGSVDLQVVP